jgi:ribosomal protein S14
MWNYRKCEVCGNAGSVNYVELRTRSMKDVELQEVWGMWNYRKCEVCGTTRSVKYVELEEE